LEKRKNFRTLLLRKAPAPQRYTNDPPPDGVQKVTYASDGRELFGWLVHGKNSAAPVVVYIHGGFAFGGVTSLSNAAPFIKAGFAVFFPTFRGENGNPGDFEHMYGEVDDVAASIRWLANQPTINSARIYAFGHSTGGAIAALLALRNDIPLRMTASSGGLYPPDIFKSWRDLTPFDYGERTETELRLMMHHADELRITHIGYLGMNDVVAYAFVEAYGYPPLKQAPKLQIEWVVGDHFEALRPSAERFIARIVMDE
jgi:acetyl esterase/lipase